MSNLNNTAPAVAASTAVKVLDTDFRPDAKVLDKVDAMPYGAFAMREIVKGLRATEKGNRHNVIHHVGQVIETVARNMLDDKRTNGTDGMGWLGETKGTDPFPTGIKNALRDTMSEVIVAMIKAGDAPYLNCGTSVARIKAMPKGTEQQRKLWDYQARKLAKATMFLNGQAVEPPKGKYLPKEYEGATQKQPIESLKVLRNYTTKVIAYLWSNHPGIFQEFAFRTADGEDFRDFDAADVETIAAILEEKAPGGMSALAHAFRKPDAKPNTDSALDKAMKAFNSLSIEDQAEFLKLAQNGHAAKVRAAENAAKAVNKGGEGDGEANGETGGNVVDIFADLRDDTAEAA